MSQPTKYTPSHAFLADSATLANFPGQALDVEFNNVAASVSQIDTNLALIQRDDGALANASVTYDSLSPSLQTNGITGALPWSTGISYIVGSAVVQSNKLYRCLVAHTSGVFATDLATGDWIFIIGIGLSGPTTSTAGHIPVFHDAAGVVLDDSGVALSSLAPLASPALTGTPTAPTAAADTNTTQIATQAAILQQASSATPLANGTAAVGTATRFARADHVHPAADFSPVTPVTAATLQAAINLAVAAGGGIVKIPVGAWPIDTSAGPINVTGSCIIQGVGGSLSTGSVLVTVSAANHLFNVTADGYVAFRDFGISNATARNAGTAGIYINETTFGGAGNKKEIERLVINAQSNGIQIANAYQFTISDNTILSPNVNGILLAQPDTSDGGIGVVTNNKIWDVGGAGVATAGIQWNSGSGCRIYDNRILGAFAYGIYIFLTKTSGDDGALLISNNMLEVQRSNGILMDRSTASATAGRSIGQMVITGHHIQALTSGYDSCIAINQSGAGGWVAGAIIANNIAQIGANPAFNAAIRISDGIGISVLDNDLYNTPTNSGGIRVDGSATDVLISGNRIEGGTQANWYVTNATTTLMGAIGVPFAALPSTVANGSQIYVTDGKPGNPLAGSGNGTFAVRVNGAWLALAPVGVQGAGRNALINADFRINQRGYASAATLAAGIYGHDRWKAGASGGDYSFTQLKSSTQITIAASKTLTQVVEDANVLGGNYVLSWSGTCTARVGLNSATPSGSFAASPILITGQTAGTVMSVEFGNGAASGTLGTVQLEAGTVASAFEYTPLVSELVKAQRYCEAISAASSGSFGVGVAQAASTSRAVLAIAWKVVKRAAPTITFSAISDWAFYNTTISGYAVWSTVAPSTTEWGGVLDVTTTTAALGAAGTASIATPNAATTAARIFISSEL